jgi:hypothetical protein
LSNVTCALTCSSSGGVPAPPSPAESAIAKHEACAAASSSSGEVRPAGCSVRDAQLTGRSVNVALELELTVPVPVAKSPVQVIDALRTAAMWIAPPCILRLFTAGFLTDA